MPSIARASVILDTIAESRRPLSLSELSERLGIPRSSVHRVVRTLEEELFVVRSQSGVGFSLGPGLLKFGMNSHLRLLAANRQSLLALAREVQENVDLAVFSGREIVVADQIVSPARMKGVTKVGQSFSLHASCIGKALLAQLPQTRVDELLRLQPMKRFTERTVTERAALDEELEAVRATGLAFDFQEHDEGISAVATGMVGPTGARQAVAVVMSSRDLPGKWDAVLAGLARINPVIDTAAAAARRPPR
ncbi:IclR family transcriptional regulator [Kribbella yunnanensis]|uniref:IclR family transcriptional regulator n=1 Tax=Kribbella yunnanensis TaxID=190194 RepID=A0ABN2IKJ8_9ACTN